MNHSDSITKALPSTSDYLYTQDMNKSKSGFTIVELLIVIVVIGILATIVVVAYRGVQAQGYDNTRINDSQNIVDALELYYVRNGNYPAPTSTAGSWERSGVDLSGQFMEYLVSYGFSQKVPVDPINNATTSTTTGVNSAKSLGQYGYYYYRYSAGAYGCDASRGAFYIFGITSFGSPAGKQTKSPGFSCPTRDWQDEFTWVTGKFED